MPKNPIEKIEIVEPPIGDFTKKSFTWRRSCFTSCSSILLFVVASFIGLRLYLGTGPSTSRTLPTYFPADIPLYDKDNVEDIITISGKYKTRGVAVSAFFPRILLSPIFYSLNDSPQSITGKAAAPWSILATPVSDNRMTVRIEWANLDAEASFVASYYKGELRKAGYQIFNESNTFQEKRFEFKKDSVDGEFYIHADPGNKTGSDFAALTLRTPSI